MTNAALIIIAVVFLTGLLYFEKKAQKNRALVTKTFLSLLFVLAAILQPHPDSDYYRFILTGLLFCLGGDVFLALPGEKMFRLGLISFLIGHVCYIGGFFRPAQMNVWVGVSSALAAIIGIWIYGWLKPHLGSMDKAVRIYILVISIMVIGAFALFLESPLTQQARWMVLCGAVSFYVADLFVARDRFVKRAFVNRLAGLPLYYGGQFLLAFSVGGL